MIFNAQTTNSARAREVFKTDHILKLEGCKKSTRRPGQSGEAVRASALRKTKTKTGQATRRDEISAAEGEEHHLQLEAWETRAEEAGEEARREVRAAGPLRCRDSAAPGETLRRLDRKTPLRQGGRPSLSARRGYCPGGGPRGSTPVPAAGRGGEAGR